MRPQCGQARVEQRVDLLFIALLVVGQQGGERAAPLLADSQLRQKFQGSLIEPEGGISSAQEHPKQTQSVFGRGGAVGCIQWVAQHMTVLILTVDPRPRTVEVLPRGAF